MKRLMRWMIRRYLPSHILIDIKTIEVLSGTLDIHVLKLLVRRYLPDHHIHRSEGKGVRKGRKQAQADAQKEAIEEYYETPEETLGD